MFREGLGQQKQGVLPAFSLSAVSILRGAHNAEFGACIKRRRNICLKSAPSLWFMYCQNKKRAQLLACCRGML